MIIFLYKTHFALPDFEISNCRSCIKMNYSSKNNKITVLIKMSKKLFCIFFLMSAVLANRFVKILRDEWNSIIL